MNSIYSNRTRLYEQFHSFEKYHSSWYHQMHELIRTFIRRIVPSRKKTAY